MVGVATGGAGEGFDAGVFVPVGDGAGGTSSGFTVRDGFGMGGAFRLPSALALTFSLAVGLGVRLISSIGVGETWALAFRFLFALIAPPVGTPNSPLPVGGLAGSTGWLFGSATNVCCDWFEFVPVSELRVKA